MALHYVSNTCITVIKHCCISRETQWEVPVEEDSHDMDIQTPSDEVYYQGMYMFSD